MKSLSQIVLAIVAVVALVAGITFVKQYQVGPGGAVPTPTPGAGPKAAAEVKLNFPDGTVWEWDPPSDGQFEQQTKGSKDFWFHNDNSVAVELGLKSKSCKCSDVSVALAPREQTNRLREAAAADRNRELAQLQAQALEINDHKGVVVQPGESGVVRLAWEDKKEKTAEERAERLVVEIWTQAQEGGPKAITKLELPVIYVPALRVTQTVVTLPDMNVKEDRTADFKCWSSTRPEFSLTAKETTADPCFTCSVTPLTEQARKDLEKDTKSRVLCGYAVRVTVHERLSDAVQMELGPFVRRISLTGAGDIEPATVLIAGVVRGDVTVGTDDDRGRIVLGFFSAKNGISKMVRVTAHRPGLDLKLDKIEPEGTYVKVKSLNQIEPAGGKARWELTIEVPPGSPSGRLPEHSAVLLTIDDSPPRHIRIPILGNATQ